MGFKFSDIEVEPDYMDAMKYRSICITLHYTKPDNIYNIVNKESLYTVGETIAENEYISIIVDDVSTMSIDSLYPEIRSIEYVKLKILFLKNDISVYGEANIIPHMLFRQCVLNPKYVNKIHIEGEPCILYPYEFINKVLVPILYFVCQNLEEYVMSNIHYSKDENANLNLFIRDTLATIKFQNVYNVKVYCMSAFQKKPKSSCELVVDDSKISVSDIEGICTLAH